MSELAMRLRQACLSHGERPALEVGKRALSYGELLVCAQAAAARFDQISAPGTPVALMFQRTVEAYVVILAAILSGRPYIPLNPKAPLERQRMIAATVRCGVFVHDSKTEEAAKILAESSGATAVSCLDLAAQDRTYVAQDARHVYVMFTSGTTGTPKGVAVRPDNVTAYLDAFAKIAAVHAADRCSQFFDLSFDLSVHDMLVCWDSGACLCAPTDEDLIDPVGFANRSGVTAWFSVPSVASMARRMRRLAPGALPSLRLALFCGEPLPTSLAAAFAAAAPQAKIWNLYGPTEATIAITAFPFEAGQAGTLPASVPLGVAYEGCAAVVVDDAGALAAAGTVGELWLAGAQITDGYLNNPAEQKSKFVSRTLPGHPYGLWYRSGDLVLVDPTWGLVYQSRLDDQVKISGYRVELLEIEEALRWAAGTPDVAAVAWPIDELGSASGIVGFVCGSATDAREIVQKCRLRLPVYMAPKSITEIDALPLNSNGKIDRKALRQRLEEKSR